MFGRPPAPRRRAIQHEKIEQTTGERLLDFIHAAIYRLGTRRPRGRKCSKCGEFVPEHQGTRQTPGLPDVLIFLKEPDNRRRLLWWEAKRPGGGKESDDQSTFRELCAAAGIDHCLGDSEALTAWLIEHGYVRTSQLPHYRVPAHLKDQ